ncbi:hypothetical protein CKM354_001199500 [Cercospora kikuchii]|uniref:M serotype protein n=1 Tax=Cercospora kikuchii TaxID=84275 RepID=A0A9P3CWG5_9PEZI|nr:uncharacterized protein CKM354_001199500 [Cercospora kikuchii]GIZ48952.1 hypothetical protein CKM354_001199500 [Cercospora kikuchii]
MSSSTPTTKKPPIPAAARRTPAAATNNSAAAAGSSAGRDSPSKMSSGATSSAAGAGATASLNRTRSTRNGAPMSARAAVRGKSATDNAADEDAKAELLAKMEDLQQKLQEAERACEESHKQAAVLQVKLDEAHKEQGMLEETVHEHTERINDLENEKKESLRARREIEQIYESEKEAAMKEKEEALKREEEMQTALQRMKETLAQREMRAGLDDDRRPVLSRHSSNARSANGSPGPDGSDRQFAPPSVSRSDSMSRMNSKLVNQKDKIIEGLRLELAEAQIKLVEVENMGGGRMQEIQKQLYDVKMHNARLMEENESFQLLLSEKTLQGDFMRGPTHSESRPPSRHAEGTSGTTLADELDSHADESEIEGDTRRLQAEINGLKDANKALTLYINNIISRLLQHDQFEAILDKTPDLMGGSDAARRRRAANTDKDLPPPPGGENEQPSLLQRAKSVMGGSAKPRPRPLSQTLTPSEMSEPIAKGPALHEDPTTAPSVPIARARSTRAPSGHRRANSEWPAASVVTNMYRGPSPNSGPLSPGLTSPINRNSFFGRAPSSGSQVPTISENHGDKDNARDSKMGSNASNRNSVISNPGNIGIDEDNVLNINNERSNPSSHPSSPPRSTTSSGDRDKPSGAIMMGSKPRPLRLVQEAADEDAAKKQANRGSWFGWMNKGGAAPPATNNRDSVHSPPLGSAGGVGQGLTEKLGGVFGQRKSESEASGSQTQ